MDRPRPVPWPSGLVVKNGSKMRLGDLGRDARAVVRDDELHAPGLRARGDGDAALRSRCAWSAFTTRFTITCWSVGVPAACARARAAGRARPSRSSAAAGRGRATPRRRSPGRSRRARPRAAGARSGAATRRCAWPGGRVLDQAQRLPVRVGPLVLAHELREGQDAAERVVDLVRHPAGELPDGGHLLGLHEAAGDLALLGDVLPDHHAPPSANGKARTSHVRSPSCSSCAAGTVSCPGTSVSRQVAVRAAAGRSPRTLLHRSPRHGARRRCWRGPPPRRRGGWRAGSAMASKQARHSVAARTSARERCSTFASSSRLLSSSSALRCVRSSERRAFSATSQYWSMALWMVSRRCPSSQGFQMKRKISDWFTASSMAAVSAWPVRRTRCTLRPALLHDGAGTRSPTSPACGSRRRRRAPAPPRAARGRARRPAPRGAGTAPGCRTRLQRSADVLVVVDDEHGRHVGPSGPASGRIDWTWMAPSVRPAMGLASVGPVWSGSEDASFQALGDR